MPETSSWRAYYKFLPNGRCWISRKALAEFETKYAHRVVLVHLRGWPEKVLMFDLPLQVGSKVREPGADAFHLLRIRLRDITGWPPRHPPRSGLAGSQVSLDSRLSGARFARRRSSALPRVELSLEARDRSFKALLVGPPVLLLKCIEATLIQEGTAGRNLRDLQELRLVGPKSARL